MDKGELSPHRPVLLPEVMGALAIRGDGVYVDGTFGRGGHAQAILACLSNEGRLLGLDKDPEAIAVGCRLAQKDSRFSIVQASMGDLIRVVAERRWLGKVDGVLFDLGVSSPQLESAERGFSFLRDGPLDMRMNPAVGQSAAEWLAKAEERTIADAFSQSAGAETLVNELELDMLIGSGGVLSHAPRRHQSAMMMIDAFLPEGITRLTVDSIFMMPHLGVLAKVHPEAATQVFEKDCIVYLGTCIAPIGGCKEGTKIAEGVITRDSGEEISFELNFGELKVIPIPVGETAKIKAKPCKGLDLGQGKNREIEGTVYGGITGIVLDGRGRRPFVIPEDRTKRIEKLLEWYKAIDMYPLESLKETVNA